MGQFKVERGQGLLLSLIAEDYIPDWKDKFMNNELFLSDFIQKRLDIKVKDMDIDYENMILIEECVNSWINKRNLAFKDLEKKTKSNVLKDGFELTGFDPMNMIKKGNEIIHNSYLRIKIDGMEQILKGPVKTTIGDHIFDVKRIEW